MYTGRKRFGQILQKINSQVDWDARSNVDYWRREPAADSRRLFPGIRHRTVNDKGRAAMKNFLKNYSLSIVLGILFLLSWGVQSWAGWQRYAGEQAEKGQQATILGSNGYVWEWSEATFENWQSEFLQLLTFVVLTSFLIHKGSHESKDGDEELKEMIRQLHKRLDKLETGGRKTAAR